MKGHQKLWNFCLQMVFWSGKYMYNVHVLWTHFWIT